MCTRTLSGKELIIEPDLKALFTLASPTPTYAAILATLPATFVGSHAKLRSLVGLMAQAMATACRQQAMPLPPWRSRSALLSRWQQAGSHDTPVSAPTAAAQQQSGAPAVAAQAGSAGSSVAWGSNSKTDSGQDAAARQLLDQHQRGSPPALQLAAPARLAAAVAAFPPAKVTFGFEASSSVAAPARADKGQVMQSAGSGVSQLSTPAARVTLVRDSKQELLRRASSADAVKTKAAQLPATLPATISISAPSGFGAAVASPDATCTITAHRPSSTKAAPQPVLAEPAGQQAVAALQPMPKTAAGSAAAPKQGWSHLLPRMVKVWPGRAEPALMMAH
jgi:hypothetical protein